MGERVGGGPVGERVGGGPVGKRVGGGPVGKRVGGGPVGDKVGGGPVGDKVGTTGAVVGKTGEMVGTDSGGPTIGGRGTEMVGDGVSISIDMDMLINESFGGNVS